MKQYHDLCKRILNEGEVRLDRTGTGTLSVFGNKMEFDLQEGFPLVTTKRVHLKSVIHELLWFLKGSTNTKYLKDNGVTIWDEWADEDGELGPVYGKQWRSWQGHDKNTIDQIAQVINRIKHDPYSRRLIVSAWNVADLPKMKLPPCHIVFQFYVHTDGTLDCMLTQRSVDVFLGLPFNIASYALLTMMVAEVCGLEPGKFVHSSGDAHIYTNHIPQVQEQLTRPTRQLPQMILMNGRTRIDDFVYEDFYLKGYDPHPAIKGAVSV